MGTGGRPWRWLLLGGALVALLWLVLGSSRESPPKAPSRAATDEVETRPEPDDATVRARKRRALAGLLARREASRAVKVAVLDCHHVPAAHAEVEILAGETHVSGLTDEGGSFLADVPVGAESLRVMARVAGDEAVEHRGEVAVATPTGSDDPDSARRPAAPIQVSVCPGATVVGVVRDEAGHTLAGATVRLGDDMTTTEADGEFVLTDLWLDAKSLSVEHALGSMTRAIEQPLAAGEERRMDITLESGRRLAGTVVGADGKGVAAIPVSARDVAGAVIETVFSDYQGRFWLKRMPTVPLWIRADDNAGRMAEVAVGATGSNESLVLRLAPKGLLIVTWHGPAGVTLVAEPGFGPWESPYAPDDESASTIVAEGRETLVTAPRYWRVQWVLGDKQGACGEGLVPAGGRLFLHCGAGGLANLTARIVDEDGRAMTGRWNVSTRDNGGQSGELDADGRFVASLELTNGTTAELSIETPGHARLDRRGLSLSPGGTNDLGTLTMMSGASVSARFPSDVHAPFGGIGARVEATPLGIALTAIARGGPLDAAGILAGDVIVAVDGVPAGMLPTFEAVKLMRGAPGSSLHLKLLRGESGLFDIEVQRALVDAEKVDWVD